jgi:ankyrin repeat protein
LLIEYGADVNAAVDVDCGPLMEACGKDMKLVEFLLENGADPNRIRKGYQYPLLKAVASGDMDLVDLLLDHGADVRYNNGYIFTKAVRNSKKMIPRLLSVPMSADERRLFLAQALQTAAYRFSLETFDWLVGIGADVNYTGGEYGTVLHACVSNSQVYERADVNNKRLLLDKLLASGADVNKIDPKNNLGPALMVAMEKGSRMTVDILLNAGADPTLGGGKLHSPLQAAYRRQWHDIAERLIESGADINAVGGTYGSPLHAAAYTHNIAAIKYLLEKGCTSLHCVAGAGKYGSVMQAAAKENAVKNGGFHRGGPSVRAMKELLLHGADPNALGGKYGCALQMAAKSNNLLGVRWLVAKARADAALRIEKSKYKTALDAARHKKHWAVVSFLEQQLI